MSNEREIIPPGRDLARRSKGFLVPPDSAFASWMGEEAPVLRNYGTTYFFIYYNRKEESKTLLFPIQAVADFFKYAHFFILDVDRKYVHINNESEFDL